MRVIPPALAIHLASGSTTLCHCWRLRRRDDVELCFTDHDRDLSFDDSHFLAGSGLSGASGETAIGMATGGTEIAGVLSSTAIAERDLAAGLFDGAGIEVWRVNWEDPAQRVLLDIHTIGEIRRTADTFTAELRSAAHAFDQERGQTYQALCSADLGDARCGVNPDTPAWSAAAQITGGDGRIDLGTSVAGFADGFFDGGKIRFLSGANAGLVRAIESFRMSPDGARVRLWERLPASVVTGADIVLSAGCDKRFTTCREKFLNQANFRGHPHIPGNDSLMSHAGSTSVRMDGGSLFT